MKNFEQSLGTTFEAHKNVLGELSPIEYNELSSLDYDAIIRKTKGCKSKGRVAIAAQGGKSKFVPIINAFADSLRIEQGTSVLVDAFMGGGSVTINTPDKKFEKVISNEIERGMVNLVSVLKEGYLEDLIVTAYTRDTI